MAEKLSFERIATIVDILKDWEDIEEFAQSVGLGDGESVTVANAVNMSMNPEVAQTLAQGRKLRAELESNALDIARELVALRRERV